MRAKSLLLASTLTLYSLISNAAPDNTQLSVWANEAIVASYTYSYQSFINDQKNIAHYFSTPGWIAYANAFNRAKLQDSIEKNSYVVSAVATSVPSVSSIDGSHWKASMNLLVVYKNPTYEQHQNLKVAMEFSLAPDGQGVRGLYINNMQSIVTEPPCHCAPSQKASTP